MGVDIVLNKHSKHILKLYLVLSMLFFLLDPGPAIGQDLEPLLFLVNGKIVPIAYEEHGSVRGVVIDIAQALAEKMGRPIEIKAMNWPEAQAQVLLGQADALLQINRTRSREAMFAFSDPLLPSEFVILRPRDQLKIRTMTDLKDKRVGVEAGGYAFQLLAEHDIENITVDSALQGLELLSSGDLDALVVDRWIGEYALAQSGISGIQIAREPLDVSYSHIAVTKGNAELLELINRGLQEINSDGTLANILDDWRGKSVVYLTREQIIGIVAAAAIAILLAISSISTFFVVKLKRLNQELEAKVARRTEELAQVNEHLRIANAELERQSMLDQLTQIPNRRGFDALFEKAWKICRRDQQPLSLILIDVDKLKSVNDQYGHLMGDQYLKEVAVVLRDTVRRPGDAVARLSGDEFAVILLNTDEEGALHVAETMRAKVEALSDLHQDMSLKFSASFGLASLIPEHSMAATELMDLADRALYKAKQSGRNKVVDVREV